MEVFLVELPVLLLLLGKGKKNILFSFCLYVLSCSLVLVLQRGKEKPKKDIQYPVLSIIICLLCGLKFFMTWGASGRFVFISEMMRMPWKQCCIILVLVFDTLAVYGVDYLIKIITLSMNKPVREFKQSISGKQIYIYIFLTALLTITLHSKCSPLYPFNDWNDCSTMFTVGKSVLKGYVPYRDLYEQKGPLLLFLHTLGAAVSFDTFLGMWLLEVPAAFFFLLMSYKTIRLFFDRLSILLLPLLSVTVYGCHAFMSGDSAEEFCLPFLAYGLFIICKALEKDEMPSKKEFLGIGLTSACVFWIKYSMTGFYLGWILVLFEYSLKKKRIPALLTGCGFITLGLVIVTIPIGAYFAVNSSLSYFWEAYFYNNFYHYPGRNYSIMHRIINGLKNLTSYNLWVLVISAAGLTWTLGRRKWRIASIFGTTFITLLHFVYFGPTNRQYYGTIFGIYVLFGMCFLLDLSACFVRLRNLVGRKSTEFLAEVLFLSLLLLCFTSNNMSYLKYNKEELFQYRFKEIIEASGRENPLVISYHTLDFGINTVAGLIPRLRFFCRFNLIDHEPMEKELAGCMDSACADYVVVYSKFENKYPEFEGYDYAGWIPGVRDNDYGYYHYFVPGRIRQKSMESGLKISPFHWE